MRMRLDLRSPVAETGARWSGEARPLHLDDLPALGELAFEAYRGSVDDHGEARAWHEAEMTATWKGGYGPVHPAASLVTVEGEHLLAAVVVTTWRSAPLLAFALTHPSSRNRGIAGELIRRSARVLRKDGADELRLAVTLGSPAIGLYRRLGFEPLAG